mmetsp:Transcript_8664/g.26591  ORF Transcript_8664/g.26591 Transcript_8664/m.26591 type:complete len:206 (+) Transcript_8664:3457-4074(+)
MASNGIIVASNGVQWSVVGKNMVYGPESTAMPPEGLRREISPWPRCPTLTPHRRRRRRTKARAPPELVFARPSTSARLEYSLALSLSFTRLLLFIRVVTLVAPASADCQTHRCPSSRRGPPASSSESCSEERPWFGQYLRMAERRRRGSCCLGADLDLELTSCLTSFATTNLRATSHVSRQRRGLLPKLPRAECVLRLLRGGQPG